MGACAPSASQVWHGSACRLACVLAQPEKCGQRQREGKPSWSPSALTPWPLQLCKPSAKRFRQLTERWFDVPGVFHKQGSDPCSRPPWLWDQRWLLILPRGRTCTNTVLDCPGAISARCLGDHSLWGQPWLLVGMWCRRPPGRGALEVVGVRASLGSWAHTGKHCPGAGWSGGTLWGDRFEGCRNPQVSWPLSGGHGWAPRAGLGLALGLW